MITIKYKKIIKRFYLTFKIKLMSLKKKNKKITKIISNYKNRLNFYQKKITNNCFIFNPQNNKSKKHKDNMKMYFN